MTNEPFDPNATQPVPPPAVPPASGVTAPVAPGPAFQQPAGAPMPGTPGPAFQPVAPEPEPVPIQATVRASGGGSRLLNVALGVAVLVAVAGISFAAGRATAPATVASIVPGDGTGNANGLPNGGFRGNGGYFPGDRNGGFVPGNGNGGTGRFGFGGGLSISGTVDSVTADSVTIKTASGQTITIGIDGSTTYHQQAAASASDVQAGKTVMVQLSGGPRPDGNNGNGAGNGTGGSLTLGAAGDITVVP